MKNPSKAARRLAGAMNRGVCRAEYPVLMYHGIEVADGSAINEDYTVPLRLFRQHLEALDRAGTQTLPIATLLEGDIEPPQPGRWALLTFDDGFGSVLEHGAAELVDKGFTGVIFITTRLLGRPGYLTRGQVRLLADKGLVVGAHGASHRYLTDMTIEELQDELVEARDELSELAGYPIKFLSLPGGRGNEQVQEESRKVGYEVVFGSRPGLVRLGGGASGLQPRFAVTARSTPKHIARLVRSDRTIIWRERLRYEVLSVPKRVLGNAVYEVLREALLGSVRACR